MTENVSEATFGHFENTDLVGRAEAVLFAAKESVGTVDITFEVKDDIHHVLKHPGASDRALLCYVTGNHYRYTGSLTPFHEPPSRFPDLAEASRGASGIAEDNSLNGINNSQEG